MARLISFQKILKEKNLGGFIVTNPVNIFYLSGFRGISPQERESILIFSPPRLASSEAGPRATLITAKLYQAEALKLQSKDLRITIADERNKMLNLVTKLLSGIHLRGENFPHLGGGRIGFEEKDLTYAEHEELKKKLVDRKLIATKNLVEDMRILKTADEIRNIEKAQIISQKAFTTILHSIKVGQTEEEISEKLYKIIKSLGGQDLAFESIIASGRNSAKPHHVTGKSKVKKGDVLLFDFGAKYKNYCADLSRTIFAGKVSDEKRNIYSLVKRAQKEAIQKIIHGIKSHKPHEHAVDIFRKENLDDYFLHGLGHGIGLAVHEAPHLRPQSKSKKSTSETLREGMVFSVEPGLYFPSWGGVRIEDLVVIKNGKAQVLGKSESEITEI